MVAEVTTIYESNASDIVAMARKFADDVENGVYGEVERVVVVARTGQGYTSFGWGRVTVEQAIADLSVSLTGKINSVAMYGHRG